MNESTKNILWWVCAIAVIALCVWGIRSCNKASDEKREIKKAEELAQIEQRKIQEQASIINDPYFYVDKNGVCHADKDCEIVSMSVYLRDDSNSPYSVSYQPKDEISDWKEFAATHQLCTECFDSDIIKALTHSLEHGSKDKKYPDSIHIYDEKSKIVEKIYRKYDTMGNIIDEEKWEFEDGKWIGKFKDEYVYDDQGHEIMHTPYQGMENGKWVGSEWFCKVEKTYSVYGNVKVEKFYNWQDNKWSLSRKIERSYDEFDQITKETHYKFVNNKWVLEEQKRRVNMYNTSEGVDRMKDI